MGFRVLSTLNYTTICACGLTTPCLVSFYKGKCILYLYLYDYMYNLPNTYIPDVIKQQLEYTR